MQPQEFKYQEFPPPLVLSRQVVCMWRLSGTAGPDHIDTVYPDGCCEVIVHLAEPPRIRKDSGSWHQQSPVLFAAQHRAALQFLWKQEVDCIGVRLQPAASELLAGNALTALKDQVVDLNTLDTEFAVCMKTRASESREAAFGGSFWPLIAARCRAEALDPLMEQAVERIKDKHGDCQIEALARQLDMSLRAFQMRFNKAVGLSPKEFARIMRLQATLKLLDSAEASLAELALDSGFSDQAHASREIRRMTGLTPARLRDALKDDRGGGETIRMAAAFVRGQSLTPKTRAPNGIN